MSKQFSAVNGRYGAPMGRASFGNADDCAPRSVHLFRVRMVDGDYDDGGAYWGGGRGVLPLWCARDDAGEYQQFIRATSRAAAALSLGIPNSKLRASFGVRALQYGLAVIDGRAPMPEHCDRAQVLDWMAANGAKLGRAS